MHHQEKDQIFSFLVFQFHLYINIENWNSEELTRFVNLIFHASCMTPLFLSETV